jgi:CxxC-x17-CxxC domain-containing protein
VPDREIKCIDCGTAFVFTEREQEWYREKGLVHDPRRCKPCRTAKKSGGGGGGGGGGRPEAEHPDSPAHEGAPDAGDRPQRGPSRSKEMYKVQCATCGKETEVPFRPDPTRPVYCRDCYLARGKKR